MGTSGLRVWGLRGACSAFLFPTGAAWRLSNQAGITLHCSVCLQSYRCCTHAWKHFYYSGQRIAKPKLSVYFCPWAMRTLVTALRFAVRLKPRRRAHWAWSPALAGCGAGFGRSTPLFGLKGFRACIKIQAVWLARDRWRGLPGGVPALGS
jgi:hypothetical protein